MASPDRNAGRWAPWWAYVGPFLVLNYARQLLLPFGTVPEVVDVLLAVGIAVAVGAVVTIAYRATR